MEGYGSGRQIREAEAEGVENGVQAEEVISYNQDGWEDPKRIPPWHRQLTVRGVVAGCIIGVVYSMIIMKLDLTTGLSPNLNVAAALLAFIFLQSWTKLLTSTFFSSTAPFTRQENTIVQTCAVAVYSIAVGGGYGSYLLALNKKTYELAGADTPGNTPGSYKEPHFGWLMGFNLITCLLGVFVLIPLRKILIVDYKLPFPSGMATAVLINGFHARGDKLGRKQLRGFLKYFSISFLWGFFQWFFTGKGGDCGFHQFPTFGLQAWKQSFYFDFSLTYVGTGMICSHLVNLSLLFGAVISWGIMWPLISKRQGDWYPANISKSSMQGLNGYKVFVSIALILGDGLYVFVKVMLIVIGNIYRKRNKVNGDEGDEKNMSLEVAKQDEVFVRDRIPMWVSVAGYVPLAIVAIIAIPIMFPQVKWYYVVVAYLLSPVLSFANAYGAGLTDQNMAYNYGKVAIFILASIGGKEHGVVAGLVGCGIIKMVAFVGCSLIQDFKTGHLTLSSPRAMIVGQAIGTVIGCISASLTFMLYYKAFDVGNPTGEYKAPYAVVYRNIAILGVQGFSALPHNCLPLCYGFFVFAVVVNLLRDVLPSKAKIGKYLPLPMVMAIPFLVGGYFAIDMCVGSIIILVLHRLDPKKAEWLTPVIASGLICGEGIWSLPSAFLSLAKVRPPLCMSFSKS